MEKPILLLLRLIVAHLLADFMLQPGSWVRSKWDQQARSSRFWMHVGVVGITSYLLLMDWNNWQVPLIIMLSHAAIDVIKLKAGKDNTAAFVVDQLAHLLVIVLVWLWMTEGWNQIAMMLKLSLDHERLWLILLGYLFNTMPLAVLIRYLTARWSNEVEKQEGDRAGAGLRDAGKYIGIVERLLIFTFILFNELRAIGFLLAAKSVFRFGDLKDSSDRKKTEYILLGTLISFAASILSGLLIKTLL